ncbi:hypothetical protein AG1IA_10205 [Rhizoctonia solani AG-1 IA]|uniref:Uncharacterized protein n=1 Tax=Thanatephorus cucumeris (strain AG1-IA) TaxID=983506 RepID=L8WCV3_THACA|nr:hypothetical protein AG1IA_10205 [Rhizoctonia solani AG-1 IA]
MRLSERSFECMHGVERVARREFTVDNCMTFLHMVVFGRGMNGFDNNVFTGWIMHINS